jgi:TonB family protein
MPRPLVFALALGLLAGDAGHTPARLRSGAPPGIPIAATGGGEVFLELDVSASGSVTSAMPFRATPPFTDAVIEAVRRWQFTPAKDEKPVASAVLVAAIFRPPVINGPTLGTPPADSGRPSPEIPTPASTPLPPFPPHAQRSGVVILEVHVAATGAVENARLVRSAPPFDDAAITTVRSWRFVPAQRGGAPVASVAYVIVGFRPPA